MRQAQHQFILDAPALVAFQKCLRSGVQLLLAVHAHGYFLGKREGEWPAVVPRKLSIEFLVVGRWRRVWNGRYRSWVTIRTCPGDDGVLEEGAGAAFIRTCDHTSTELIYVRD